MPTFYNYTQDGLVYSFDDVFVPADAFREGNLWAWGSNSYGGLGDNTSTLRLTPVITFAGGTNWKQISIGVDFIAAIKTDGTLWTWGKNSAGQLGDNTTISRSTPVTTFAGGADWKSIACGDRHTAAIKTDGTLWTWGFNNGNIGDNTRINRSTPVTTFVGGTNWKQVSGGVIHTAAIKIDGTLWTWGVGSDGQLGNNNVLSLSRSVPEQIFAGGTNWKQVACGNVHTAAIKTDGTLWVWGSNSFGQLGNNTSTSFSNRCTPVTTFAGGTNWKQVAVSRDNTLAIKTDGTLWVWGAGTSGQLGTNESGTFAFRVTPVTTFAGGTNWKQVAGAPMAIKTDGTLWVWGANNTGQLGNRTLNNASTPVTTFLGGTNWKSIGVNGATGDIRAAITFEDPIFPT
jgi:hypothetical protein